MPFIINTPTVAAPAPPVLGRFIGVFSGAKASIRNRTPLRQPTVLSSLPPAPPLSTARFVSVQAGEASLRNRQQPRQPLHFPAGGRPIPIARSVVVLAKYGPDYYRHLSRTPIVIGRGSTAAAPGQKYVRQLAAQASLRNRQTPQAPIVKVGKTKITVPLPPAVIVYKGAVAASRLARHEPHQPIVLRGSTDPWPGPKQCIVLAAQASLRNRDQPRQPLVNIGPDNDFVQPCPYLPRRIDPVEGYRPARVSPTEAYTPARVPVDDSYRPRRVGGCG